MANLSCFGTKLREIRTKRGISGKALAERMFVNYQGINHYEDGYGSSRYPTLRTIVRIATALEANDDELRELVDAAIEDLKKEDRKLWKA